MGRAHAEMSFYYPAYAYAVNQPLFYIDPDGYGPRGAGIGATILGGIGAGVGAKLGGGTGVLMCWETGPGALACGAGGAIAGAAGGAAIGIGVGAVIGSAIEDLICKPKDKDKEHCIAMYEQCVQRGWGGPCGDCLNYCTAQGVWPFHMCGDDVPHPWEIH